MTGDTVFLIAIALIDLGLRGRNKLLPKQIKSSFDLTIRT